jgi:hypothetical protein
MIRHPVTRRNIHFRAVLLLLLVTSTAAGCRESTAPSQPEAVGTPRLSGWEMSPLQQRMLARPVAPKAAGRPATRADLEEVRNWFGPGEMEAVLAIVNRSARANGTDTLPHCVPLCNPATAAEGPSAR